MNARHKCIAALMMSAALLVSGCGDDKPVDTRQSNVLPTRNNVDTDLSDIETLDEPAVEQKNNGQHRRDGIELLEMTGSNKTFTQSGSSINSEQFIKQYNSIAPPNLQILQLIEDEFNPTRDMFFQKDSLSYGIIWSENNTDGMTFAMTIFNYDTPKNILNHIVDIEERNPSFAKNLDELKKEIEARPFYERLEDAEVLFADTIRVVDGCGLDEAQDILRRLGFYDDDGYITQHFSQNKNKFYTKGDLIYAFRTTSSSYQMTIMKKSIYDNFIKSDAMDMLESIIGTHIMWHLLERYNPSIPRPPFEKIDRAIAFDGSKYDLNDLSEEEQIIANYLFRHGYNVADIRKKIMYGRSLNGGKPVDSKTEPYIADKTLSINEPLQSGDLMLGSIALGDSYDSVIKKMGEPLMQETTQDDTLLFTYVSMKIGFKNNKVVLLMSSDSPHFVKTPRGIVSRHFDNGVMSQKYPHDDAVPFYHDHSTTREMDANGNIINSVSYPIKAQDGLPACLIFQTRIAKKTYDADDGIRIIIRYE